MADDRDPRTDCETLEALEALLAEIDQWLEANGSLSEADKMILHELRRQCELERALLDKYNGRA